MAELLPIQDLLAVTTGGCVDLVAAAYLVLMNSHLVYSTTYMDKKVPCTLYR